MTLLHGALVIVAFFILVSLVTIWVQRYSGERRKKADYEPSPFARMNQGELAREQVHSLTAEYQAAQDSAQHHDSLIWTTTGILWGASLVLMGFLMNAPSVLHELVKWVPWVGIGLIVVMAVCCCLWGGVVRQKYRYCKKLESRLGLGQHTTLRHPSYSMRILYTCLSAGLITLWLILLAHAPKLGNTDESEDLQHALATEPSGTSPCRMGERSCSRQRHVDESTDKSVLTLPKGQGRPRQCGRSAGILQ